LPLHFNARIFLLCLIVSSALVAHAQQPKTDSEAAVSKILQAKEQEWLNAEKNHDAVAFEKIVADDWVSLTPDGKRQSKAERAAEIKSAHTTSATLGDVNVRVFGNAAVVTGTDDEVTEESGKKSIEHYVWTDVFVKRNGDWLAVASQTALVK
jgi:ketosteroid isomerase-like protein